MCHKIYTALTEPVLGLQSMLVDSMDSMWPGFGIRTRPWNPSLDMVDRQRQKFLTHIAGMYQARFGQFMGKYRLGNRLQAVTMLSRLDRL